MEAVADGESLTQLQSKFFNTGLSVTEKIDKGYKLRLEDFATMLNDHLNSLNSGIPEAEYIEAVRIAKDVINNVIRNLKVGGYFFISLTEHISFLNISNLKKVENSVFQKAF